MNNPLVSVIIPAYNTAKYVEDMLKCVINQTYANVEVIVINDGSTDRTLEICQKVRAKHSNITVIDIPNGGVSNARNIGIERCRGEKIFFWDSDDIIEPSAIEKCVRFGEEHNVNAVLHGYANRINGVKGKPHKSELRDEYRGEEIVNELMPHFLGHSFADINKWIQGECSMRQGKEHTALWRIMLDASTVKKNGLKFDTSLSLGEDTRFINEYMLYEPSIGYIDECLYYLTIRNDGANRTSMESPEKRLADKVKLICARADIDDKAMKLHRVDTHRYWEGTLTFSAVEMAMRLAKNANRGVRENHRLYKNFLANTHVARAIADFNPQWGRKSIPFKILRLDLGSLLFALFLCLPQSITRGVK